VTGLVSRLASLHTHTVNHAFDPSSFRALGHQLVELMSEHLEAAQHGRIASVMPALTPREACARYPMPTPSSLPAADAVMALMHRVLEDSTALHAPRFMGHQVATPLPAAALLELCSTLLNNGMAIFEMGKAGSAMERAILQLVAQRCGLPATSGGVLTSGGSLGNLTALLAARQAEAGFDVWQSGMRQGKDGAPLAVLVAETAHYSVSRGARIAGFGDDGCIAVAVDEAMRMRPEALREAILRTQKKQRTIVAVIASAGSTAVGALDPLDAIADICAEFGLWFHVDGAHGGALAFSDRHRPRLRGIERADSVVIDFHKMMLMPALCTAVLFRDAKQGAAAFAQQAAYLFENPDHDDDAWSDIGKRTIECTKRSMSLPIYACWQAYGDTFFADHIDGCCALTTTLADLIAASPHLELRTQPDMNICCFRIRGAANGAQAALRRAIVAEGHHYIVQVHLHNELWLRTTLLNPLTTVGHLQELVQRLEQGALATSSSIG
jgi:L-2,4-diaminobutyrate decarboxylase